LKNRLVGALAGAGLGLAMLATGVPSASASVTVTQPYTCATSLGNLAATAKVTGTASKIGTKINLKKVLFKVTNPTTFQLTVDHIKISVPDPSAAHAPYVARSAKVALTPAGWTAGHGTTGVFASFAGSQTIAAGATVANAALSASYKNAGPAGTVINFVPGQVSFHVSSPVSTTATCTPNGPMTFATVTE
jgi:hypothetical protein